MTFQGRAVSEGYACGPALLYSREAPPEMTGGGLAEYLQAKEKAKKRIQLLVDSAAEGKIFQAHLDLLEDPNTDEMIREGIAGGEGAAQAVEKAYRSLQELFGKSPVQVIRERTADLQDICAMLLDALAGRDTNPLEHLEKPVILVANNLLPSDTVLMDKRNILALVDQVGGETSHAAILARSYGIPAVLGVTGVCQAVEEDQEVAVDGKEGTVTLSPDEDLKACIQEKRQMHLEQKQSAELYLTRQAVTTDGTRVPVKLNVGSADSQQLEAVRHTDGSGLLRSEFLYMDSRDFPGEERQFQAYRSILEAFGKRPVTLRTLDIGGDKTLPYFTPPPEENPALGCRALRFCFRQPEVFHTQLRAALRAADHGSLELMFPMVGGLEEFRQAKGHLEQAAQQLGEEGPRLLGRLKVGVMIEIPSIALMAEEIAQEADFASIGTNDLAQYLMAADRMNAGTAAFANGCHPAMLRLIRHVAAAFGARGKPLGVCGEMAGNPAQAALLLGLGVGSLSMNGGSLAAVKQMICTTSMEAMRSLAEAACRCQDTESVQKLLDELINRKD